MNRSVGFMLAALAAAPAGAGADMLVKCGAGASLNDALLRLGNKSGQTVVVAGTCREYVTVRGLDGLTIRGLPGATLEQPAQATPIGVFAVLTVEATRSVTLRALTIRATRAISGLVLRGASTNTQVSNVVIDGGGIGVMLWPGSEAYFAGVTLRPGGWAGIGLYGATAHVEDSLIEGSADSPTDPGMQVGIQASSSYLAIHGTTIRNMQVGLTADTKAVMITSDFADNVPLGGPTDVVIENPANNSYCGVQVMSGSMLTVNAKLRIAGPGGIWWSGAGVCVEGNSILRAGSMLEIDGSQGQGLLVTNQSFAALGASVIRNSIGNGVLVLNASTVGFGGDATNTEVLGSQVKDVACDSRSFVTGANRLSATTFGCPNVVEDAFEPIQWRP
jgi:hypothetical protein